MASCFSDEIVSAGFVKLDNDVKSGNVCYVKQLVEEVEDGINKIYVKDCIDINYSSCIINPRVINNKFMFRFTFLSDWSRKRGLLKKLNKKSILNFVNKLDSNHIFLY